MVYANNTEISAEGAYLLQVSNPVQGILRNVDEDGVISYSEGERDTARFSEKALLRQVFQNTEPKYLPIVASVFGGVRETEPEKLMREICDFLIGAEIDLTWEKAETDEGHAVFFYETGCIKPSSAAALRLCISYFGDARTAMEFVKNF